jgi:hypothetical protein
MLHCHVFSYTCWPVFKTALPSKRSIVRSTDDHPHRSVSREIKEDTSEIRRGVAEIADDTALIPEMRDDIAELRAQFLAWRTERHGASGLDSRQWVLERWLDSVSSYCDSIVGSGSAEVDEHQDDEDEPWPFASLEDNEFRSSAPDHSKTTKKTQSQKVHTPRTDGAAPLRQGLASASEIPKKYC